MSEELRKNALSGNSSHNWRAVALVKLAVCIATFLLFMPEAAQAYIGPGAGFAVAGSALVLVVAVMLGFVIIITWPARFLWRFLRYRKTFARARTKRVIILGFDGMDPGLAEKMMAAGRLPNLQKLRDKGVYAPLATSCPAMSPTAWSSFMTGTGPGRHGIFDFLHRDPRTYLPALSSAEIKPPHRVLRWRNFELPLSRPRIRLLRGSTSFWEVLGKHGIFSTVLRVPITFPPEKFYGLMISGMCVPDLRGSQGSFTLFTSAQESAKEHIGGLRLPLTRDSGIFCGALPGPPKSGGDGAQAVTLPFKLKPGKNGTMQLEIGLERIVLQPGKHSDWISLRFPMGHGANAHGICRFSLRQVEPEVELYVSPINIDPEHAALPVSHPAIYAIYLSKKLGRFATLGLAEDTWALNESAIDDGAFLEQCRLYFEERERMLFNALDNSRNGCIVCVFDTTDRVQHMFWRYRDPNSKSPMEQDKEKFREAIEDTYEQCDKVVGKVLEKMKDKEALFVMSDHGFKAFRRGVNLNAWLLQNGYLKLKPETTGEAEWLREVDWEQTRAYALGLAGLYLNVAGREAQGIVAKSEVQALKEELIGKLNGLRDEEKNAVAIEQLYNSAVVNAGPYVGNGPDLIVGYGEGYRVSWDAAQGKVAGSIIEDNTRRWSGDHCLDPAIVPGCLFSNWRLKVAAPRIMDIAPTVLSLFGVKPPAYMQGRSLLAEEEQGSTDHV